MHKGVGLVLNVMERVLKYDRMLCLMGIIVISYGFEGFFHSLEDFSRISYIGKNRKMNFIKKPAMVYVCGIVRLIELL